MARGYMGKILNVNLATGEIEEETLDEELCRDYIGGYGIGAKLLYERIPAGADPLGPSNILGLLTGPLTGTPAIIGSRFVAVGKSPNTGGWGDANCGGFFGPHLKFAGFDGVLFSGISQEPVYLLIDEGEAELCDASDLWGLGVTPMEDKLKARHGDDVEICSIGPAGEKLSLMAAIMNDKERAAGRSGLGAVMGSKRLKAVVVKGQMEVPVADREELREVRRNTLQNPGGSYENLHEKGTAGITAESALSGDSPVKNWGGVGVVDFPQEKAQKIDGATIVEVEGYEPYGCWRCPIRCGGKMPQVGDEFPLELNEGIGHKPEYETLCMFGTNLLNDDLASIIRLNEICNNAGLDTISVGATVGYIIECYEEGLLSAEDVDGLEMTWGNAEAIVAMTEKIAKREGAGDLFADGIRTAWKKLGREGTEYAIEIGGEEVPAHDPKFVPGLATTYTITATPARHTQGGELVPPPQLEFSGDTEPVYEGLDDKYTYTGKAEVHWKLVTAVEVVNAAGLCLFGWISYPAEAVPAQLAAVTGWDFDMDKVYEAGMRIYTMRHAFNLREGQNPLLRNVPGRTLGKPPQEEGPLEGITVDMETLNSEFLEFVDWDQETTVPSQDALRDLGMDFLIEDMQEAEEKL